EALVLKVSEALDALIELRVLIGKRRDRLDLIERSAQLLGLARSAVPLGHEHVELALAVLPLAVHRLVLREHRRELLARETVESLSLGCGRLEAQLLGLAVHDDELAPQVGEHANGSRATPDDSPAASLRGDAAVQDQFGTTAADGIDLAARIRNPLRHRAALVDEPPPLDRGRRVALAHDTAVGAGAEQEPERRDDHGLARARLTRERRESGPERQARLADDPEIADLDLLDHLTPSPRTAESLMCRLDRDLARRRALRAPPSRNRQLELVDEPVGEGSL